MPRAAQWVARAGRGQAARPRRTTEPVVNVVGEPVFLALGLDQPCSLASGMGASRYSELAMPSQRTSTCHGGAAETSRDAGEAALRRAGLSAGPRAPRRRAGGERGARARRCGVVRGARARDAAATARAADGPSRARARHRRDLGREAGGRQDSGQRVEPFPCPGVESDRLTRCGNVYNSGDHNFVVGQARRG